VSFLLEHHNWIWLLAALASGGLLLWPRLGAAAGGITPQEAVRLINRERALVIDVSDNAEFAAGHVNGARNVPLAQLDGATKELPSDKARPLVVVCASGARASRAAKVLAQKGHQQVHVLAGGMKSWREAQLPVEKAA
jgi:rhodanese-related sulfurtransferase